MEYVYHILIVSAIYAVLAMSLNIVVGYTGILSLAHAAFYGIGAYTSALLTLRVHLPFLAALLAGALVAAAFGCLLGLPSLRIRGDYLLMATLGFGEIVRSIMVNWDELTGGPIGLIGIPAPTVLFITVDTSFKYFLLALGVAVALYAVNLRLKNSQLGRVLRAIRDDEVAAGAIGKNVLPFKMKSLALGAFQAGIAGALYAHFTTYIDPSTFTTSESILIFSMMILGGLGNPLGSVVGAFILTLVPEALRFLGLPSSAAASIRQALFGLLLICVMILRPRGLMGDFRLR